MAFRNFFGGQQRDSGPPPSVLAEWNKYSQQAADIEAGASTSAAGETSNLIGESSQKIQTFFKDSFSTVSAGVSSGFSGGQSSASQSFQVPTTKQILYCLSFLAAGALFLFLAFFVFLPIVIIAPAKFALSFTLGSGCVMGAFMALRGLKASTEHMISTERLPFTLGYLGSMCATVYAAVMMHSYILSVVFSALQMVALLYYTLSYFPGGAKGVQFMLSMLGQSILACFQRR